MKTNSMMIRALSAVLALLFLFALPARALDDMRTPCNWYFSMNDRHERPTLDAKLKFIEDYDCIYLGKDEKVVYLTFDAGYENGNVAKCLDALFAHKAQAAFFILDNLVRRNAELVKRMADEGHLVCNHTAKHPDMSAITDKALFAKQLRDLEKICLEKTGREPARFYRPPQGRFSKENLIFAKELGYTTVFWSFAYADWDNNAQPDPERSLEKILCHVHPGMVLLLHPTSKTNAAILDRLLGALEKEGYRFGSLEELRK